MLSALHLTADKFNVRFPLSASVEQEFQKQFAKNCHMSQQKKQNK
jgi:hypothetical protein